MKLAEQSKALATGPVVSGIVAHANMLLGNDIEEVLLGHIHAGNGLFRGIRHHAVWDASDDVPKSRINPPADLMQQRSFMDAMNCLGRLNLSFDAWIYHPQMLQLKKVALAHPNTSTILNHLGTPIGVGPYEYQKAAVFQQWKKDIKSLSECNNVSVKLG